jgi:hypothetical protein
MIVGGLGAVVAGGIAGFSGFQRRSERMGSPEWGLARDRQLKALGTAVGASVLFTTGYAIPEADYNVRYVEKPVIRTVVKKVPVYNGVKVIKAPATYERVKDKCLAVFNNSQAATQEEMEQCHNEALMASGMKVRVIIKPNNYQEVFNACGNWNNAPIDKCHLIAMQATGMKPAFFEKPVIKFREKIVYKTRPSSYIEKFNACVGPEMKSEGDANMIIMYQKLRNQRIAFCSESARRNANL